MHINEMDDLIGQYRALERAVLAAALVHVPDGPSKRYARLAGFYVDSGMVRVDLKYSGPYSSSTSDVDLLPEEIALAEPLVKPIESVEKPEGEGWHHRIDDIPDLDREVDAVFVNGAKRRALVQSNICDRDFLGIGSMRQYHILSKPGVISGEIMSPRLLVWWRYAD